MCLACRSKNVGISDLCFVLSSSFAGGVDLWLAVIFVRKALISYKWNPTLLVNLPTYFCCRSSEYLRLL